MQYCREEPFGNGGMYTSHTETVESPWSSDFRHHRLPHDNPFPNSVIEKQSPHQMLSSTLRFHCPTHLLICTGCSRPCQHRGHATGRIPPVRTHTMSSAGTTSEARVAGFAWQLQKLGPPGKVAAGAFTSPFSLYVALALALRGTGKDIIKTYFGGVLAASCCKSIYTSPCAASMRAAAITHPTALAQRVTHYSI